MFCFFVSGMVFIFNLFLFWFFPEFCVESLLLYDNPLCSLWGLFLSEKVCIFHFLWVFLKTFSELLTFPWEMFLVMNILYFVVSRYHSHADSLIWASYYWRMVQRVGRTMSCIVYNFTSNFYILHHICNFLCFWMRSTEWLSFCHLGSYYGLKQSP